MNCVIFGSSSINNYSFYKDNIKHNDFIICADGGVDHILNMGLTPNVLIGDMDSCSKSYDFSDKIVYPKEKDDTDSILCLKYAIKKGFFNISMYGCLGGRLDHTLANIQALKYATDNHVNLQIIDETTKVFLIKDYCEIKKDIYNNVSFIPLTEMVDGVTYEGLKYPLENAIFNIGNPYGVSNEFINDYATVKIKKGLLICILTV